MTNQNVCEVCDQPRHWCINPDCGNGEGQLETGHYGTTPAKYCDDCRYARIMSMGYAGDEPTAQQIAGLVESEETVH